MLFPTFKYHPNPIENGSIIKSDQQCICCEQSRGYIYTASFYTEQEVSQICPWCIADGTAAVQFEGMFIDDFFLLQAGVSKEVIDEVCDRTPGYHCFQQEQWQTHCTTACIFLGEASKEDLISLSDKTLTLLLKKYSIKPQLWQKLLVNYEKGMSPLVLKFKCPTCDELIYTLDFD